MARGFGFDCNSIAWSTGRLGCCQGVTKAGFLAAGSTVNLPRSLRFVVVPKKVPQRLNTVHGVSDCRRAIFVSVDGLQAFLACSSSP